MSVPLSTMNSAAPEFESTEPTFITDVIPLLARSSYVRRKSMKEDGIMCVLPEVHYASPRTDLLGCMWNKPVIDANVRVTASVRELNQHLGFNARRVLASEAMKFYDEFASCMRDRGSPIEPSRAPMVRGSRPSYGTSICGLSLARAINTTRELDDMHRDRGITLDAPFEMQLVYDVDFARGSSAALRGSDRAVVIPYDIPAVRFGSNPTDQAREIGDELQRQRRAVVKQLNDHLARIVRYKLSEDIREVSIDIEGRLGVSDPQRAALLRLREPYHVKPHALEPVIKPERAAIAFSLARIDNLIRAFNASEAALEPVGEVARVVDRVQALSLAVESVADPAADDERAPLLQIKDVVIPK